MTGEMPETSMTTDDGIGISVKGTKGPGVMLTLSSLAGGRIQIPLMGEDCEKLVMALIGHYGLAVEFMTALAKRANEGPPA